MFSKRFEGQNLANTSWSFATLRVTDENFFDAVAKVGKWQWEAVGSTDAPCCPNGFAVGWWFILMILLDDIWMHGNLQLQECCLMKIDD